MSDNAKPAHPQPWRWVPFEGAIALVDGNGKPLVFTDLIHDDVAAVTELAPEMEGLLRRHVGCAVEDLYQLAVDTRSLLAKLDDARKASP